MARSIKIMHVHNVELYKMLVVPHPNDTSNTATVAAGVVSIIPRTLHRRATKNDPLLETFIVSNTEKILKGDWFIYDEKLVLEATNNEQTDNQSEVEKCKKILAFEEEIHPNLLRSKVLKDGDEVFVECEVHDEWLKENPPFDNDKSTLYYQVSFFNSFVATHILEPKKYTLGEINAIRTAAFNAGRKSKNGELLYLDFNDYLSSLERIENHHKKNIKTK